MMGLAQILHKVSSEIISGVGLDSDEDSMEVSLMAGTGARLVGNWSERSVCDQRSNLGRPLFLVLFHSSCCPRC